ncbi:hypothetical protein ACFFU9_12850 [Mariniflexile ostreae]|uniref:Uncharacterized protein n=1 Tax=Mariniflexile ostreae TaxID=1520892 RepID=A0ABV5FE34_9FLAO
MKTENEMIVIDGSFLSITPIFYFHEHINAPTNLFVGKYDIELSLIDYIENSTEV